MVENIALSHCTKESRYRAKVIGRDGPMEYLLRHPERTSPEIARRTDSADWLFAPHVSERGQALKSLAFSATLDDLFVDATLTCSETRRSPPSGPPLAAAHDQIVKRRIYERAGVPEYWLVHPQDRTVTIYMLIDGQYGRRDIFELKGETPIGVLRGLV